MEIKSGQRWMWRNLWIVEIVFIQTECCIIQYDNKNNWLGYRMDSPKKKEIEKEYWTYLEGQDCPGCRICKQLK